MPVATLSFVKIFIKTYRCHTIHMNAKHACLNPHTSQPHPGGRSTLERVKSLFTDQVQKSVLAGFLKNEMTSRRYQWMVHDLHSSVSRSEGR
jgi:hypothetical protein